MPTPPSTRIQIGTERLLADFTPALNDGEDCCQGTDAVGDVIGSVRKRHGAGGKDHHRDEGLFHAGEVKILVSRFIDFDPD